MVDPRKEDAGLPDKNLWQTPIEVFRAIIKLTGIEFDLDPCAPPENNLGLPYFYTEKDDGLVQPWITKLFSKPFVNCPFDEKEKWLRKAIKEAMKGARIGMLLEASTDAEWFHFLAGQGYIYLLLHRIEFNNPKKRGEKGQGRRGHCVIVFELDETGKIRKGIQLARLDMQTKLEIQN